MACSMLSEAVSVCVLQTRPLCSSSREDKLSTVLQEAVTCVTRTSPELRELIPPLLLTVEIKKEVICSKLYRKEQRK